MTLPSVDVVERLLDRSRDGVLVLDHTAGRFVYANEAACVITGLDHAVLHTIGPSDLWAARSDRSDPCDPCDPHDVDPMVRSAPSGWTASEVTFTGRDGVDRVVELRIDPPDGAGRRVATLTDVTARRQRDHALAEVTRLRAVLADREQSGHELHEAVARDVVDTALGLGALVPFVPGHLQARVQSLIDLQQATARRLRAALVAGGHRPSTIDDLPAALEAVAAEAEPALGFRPDVRVDGPIDRLDDPALADAVVAVVRTAFANAARHARAMAVVAVVAVRPATVEVTVTDDSVRSTSPASDRDLDDLADRARRLGGRCTVGPALGGGTEVRWSARRKRPLWSVPTVAPR